MLASLNKISANADVLILAVLTVQLSILNGNDTSQIVVVLNMQLVVLTQANTQQRDRKTQNQVEFFDLKLIFVTSVSSAKDKLAPLVSSFTETLFPLTEPDIITL